MSSSEVTRRMFLKRGMHLFAGAGVMTAMSGGYSVFVEPYWFQVEKRRIEIQSSDSVPPFTILHMSDLHYGLPLGESQVEEIVETIESLSPDLICFTGDIADHSSSKISQIIPYFSRLMAPLGKFAVLGNHDSGHPGMNSFWKQSGFRLLNNQNRTISIEGHQVAMVGVEDWLTGEPDMDKALDGVPTERLTILLSHCPDYVDVAKEYPIDLQLSGHNHGGQVKLPLLGPLIKIQGAKKYPTDGLFAVDGSQMQLYISRGLGCSKLPIRFLCRPQITLLEIV